MTKEDSQKTEALKAENDSLKRQLEQYTKSFERQRNIIELLPDGIITMDTKGTITSCNRTFLDVIGYDEKDIIGKNFSSLPEANTKELPGYTKLFRSVVCGKRIKPYEFKWMHSDGRERTTEARVAIIKEGIRITGIQVVLRDITVSKRIEKALKESEIEYRQLFELGSDAMFLIDRKSGNILDMNATAEKLYGYTHEEALKLKTTDFSAEPEKTVKAMKTRQTYMPLRYHRRKDGTVFPTEISITYLPHKNDDVSICAVRDITERKKAEEALKESEEKYLAVLENANEAIYVIQDDKPKYMNQKMEDILGYSKEELLDTDFTRLIYKDDLEETMKYYLMAARGKNSPSRYKLRMICKNGILKWVEVSAARLAWEGRPAFLGFMSDITERVKTEKALKESEEKFSRAFRSCPDRIAITTLDEGLVLDVNDSYLRYTGYTRDDVIGHTMAELDSWIDMDVRKRIVKLLKEEGRVVNEEVELRIKSGEIRTSLFSAEMIGIGGKECMISIAADITERKRIEDALRESEEIFSKAFNVSSNIKSISRRSDGSFMEINKGFTTILGYTREDAIGNNADDLNLWVNLVDRTRLISMVDRKISVVNEEIQIRTKSGKILTVLYSAEPIIIGGEDCTMHSITDITRRKEVLKNLKESEEFSHSLLEKAPHAILVVNPDTSIRYINPRFEEENGWTLEEVRGIKVPYPWWPDDMQDASSNGFIQAMEQGNGHDETIVQKKNGDRYWIDMHWSTATENGEIKYMMVHSFDITERRQAEDDVAHAKEFLENIINSMNDGFSILDPDGMQIDVNSRFCEMTGFSKEELIGVGPPHPYWPPEELENIECAFAEVLKQKFTTLEMVFMRKNGERFPVMVSPSASRDENGNIISYFATVKDITEIKKAEIERERADKLESIGTLAGGIAHDFNNLLTGIMGNISLAIRSTKLDNKKQLETQLQEAENASERARDLTQQLLTFARGGAPVKKPVSITKILLESATFSLRGSNIKPEFSLQEYLPPVDADEGQMNQVFTNLFINAQESMPEGGNVRISAKDTDIRENGALPLSNKKYIEIAVEDQGIGIKKEHLDRIFEPYFTTKQKGSGLGLATAYSIIKSHNGYISAESSIGTGSVFRVYLPVSGKKIKKEKKVIIDNFVQKTGKILVMDDEEVIRKMLEQMLIFSGYEVVLTNDGAEAIEQYTQAAEAGKPFDAVIMDLTIPGGIGGSEACKHLLEIDPDVKAIVSSGYATDPIMSDYLSYGFCAVITKPYSADQLETVLNSVLEEKKASGRKRKSSPGKKSSRH